MNRVLRDLSYWRKTLIRSFEKVNRSRYGEEYGREVREKVDKDKALIKHIDPLIIASSEFLKLELPKLEEVPRVMIRKLAIIN